MRSALSSVSAARVHLALAGVLSLSWLLCIVIPLPPQLNPQELLRGILLFTSAFLLSVTGISAMLFSRRRDELYYFGFCLSQSLPCVIIGALIQERDQELILLLSAWFVLPLVFVVLNLYVKKRQR